MSAFRSLLFVPGSRPERFAKAAESKADIICIDLEDAVPQADKDDARAAALAHLAAVANPQRWALRINGVATPAGLADLLALRAAPSRPTVLLIPMVESPDEVRIVREILADPTIAFVPLVETAAALARTASIAAERQVGAMMFGGGDLSADLGVALAWEPLRHARGAFLLGCAAAGVRAVDVPFIHMSDPEGLAEEARLCRAIGFQAKAAIHPAQIDSINAALSPSPEELDEAREAIAAYREAGGRAVRHRGRMLEAPIIKRYEELLAMEGNTGNA